MEFNQKFHSLLYEGKKKKLIIPGALPPGSAEGGQPTPMSCYAETTAVLRVGVVEVPLCAGAAAAAAGPFWDAVVVGPPIRVLSFKQTVTQKKNSEYLRYV